MRSVRSFFHRFHLVPLLALIFAGNAYSLPDPVIAWTQAMKKMYQKYPSSRLLIDSRRLEETMKLIDPKSSGAFKSFMKDHPDLYDQARAKALESLPHAKAIHGRVVISGGSASGSTVGKVFSSAGYDVEIYEARAVATRQVQWGARQELVSAFHHYYGQEAHGQLEDKVFGSVGGSYKHIEWDDMTEHPLPSKTGASSAGLLEKMSGSHIVSTASVGAVEVAGVENLTREYIQKDPNIHLTLGQATPPLSKDADGRYRLEGEKEPPKFVIIAEGAGAKSAKAIGIERIAMSPTRLQVAGVVHTDIVGGNAVGGVFNLPGSDYTIASGSMHRDGSGKVWLVTDLDPKAVQPGPSFLVGTPEFDAERARLVEKHYREIASRVLNISPSEMAKLKVSGATGKDLMPFNMELGLSATAVKGNAILIGDAVGNGHWSVGAGGMIGMTAHPDDIANFLNDLERGVKPEIASKLLNNELRKDSFAWIRAGIAKMYPGVPTEKVEAAFGRALTKYNQNHQVNFAEAFDTEVKRNVKAPLKESVLEHITPAQMRSNCFLKRLRLAVP